MAKTKQTSKAKGDKKPGAKKVMGRPTLWTKALGDKICAEISGGKSMRKVCEAENMPSRETVYSWLRTQEDFPDQYARACAERGVHLAEDALEIADEEVPEVETQFSSHLDAAAVKNKQLRIDTRKWFASKLAPKTFGDKVVQEHQGPGGGPIAIEQVPPPDYKRAMEMLKKHESARQSG